MASLSDLSVIVPVAIHDSSWIELLNDLVLLPMDTEIIFVSPELPIEAPRILSSTLGRTRPVRWQTSAPGRAIQLNTGARVARKKYLWFLHADSKLAKDSLLALDQSLRANPNALYYFDLSFKDDGPIWMRLNSWGVWIRSHLFKMPFGDQGFCISREVFELLGGFSESAAYGEDHLLVWEARRSQIPILSTGAELKTSARKYAKNGWLSTTLWHLYLTARQAFPQSFQSLKEELGKAKLSRKRPKQTKPKGL